MEAYSKIEAPCKIKSRSIDYSDLTSFPQSLKPRANDPNPESQESNRNKSKWAHGCFPEEEDENGGGGEFGAVLGRNSSVSYSTSGLHSAVKRALSMRRSSSVAERYCRIHDQCLTLASPIDDEEVEGEHSKEGSETTRSAKKKKHRAGKILKACKRLFGL